MVEPAKSMKPRRASQPPPTPVVREVPLPGAGDRIENADEDQREDDEFAELDPLGHQAGDDGGRCAGKGCLEQEIDAGDKSRARYNVRGDGWIEEQTAEFQNAGDHPVGLVHQLVADEPVGAHGESEHHQVLGQDVDRIFLAAHPGFNHGEAGIHEDHQHRRHQQPEVVGKEFGCKRCSLGKGLSPGRQIEDPETHQGQGHTGQPHRRAIGSQAANAVEEEHRPLQKAGFLKCLAAPLRRRLVCSCHE